MEDLGPIPTFTKGLGWSKMNKKHDLETQIGGGKVANRARKKSTRKSKKEKDGSAPRGRDSVSADGERQAKQSHLINLKESVDQSKKMRQSAERMVPSITGDVRHHDELLTQTGGRIGSRG